MSDQNNTESLNDEELKAYYLSQRESYNEPVTLHVQTLQQHRARCGCTATCACAIDFKNDICPANSSTVTLSKTGSGSQANPYILSAKLPISADPNNTITCKPDGINAAGASIIADNADEPCKSVDVTVTVPTPNHFVIAAKNNFAADQPGSTIALQAPGNLGTNILRCLTPAQGGPGLGVFAEDVQDVIGAEIGSAIAGTCLTYNDATAQIDVQIAPDVADPGVAIGNGAECGVNGLLVAPSADAGNTITFGADGRLYAAGAALVGDTDNDNCVNVAITGVGTAINPFVLEGSLVVDPDPCNAAACGPGGLLVQRTTLTAIDTPCFNVDVGVQGPCANDLNIQVNPIISPDPCNGLQCRGNGLFAFHDPSQLPNRVAQSSNVPSQALAGTVSVTIGPTVCVSITNPSQCRAMAVAGDIYGDISISKTGGQIIISIEGQVPPGPFGATSSRSGLTAGTPSGAAVFNMYNNDFDFGVVPPGATVTVCGRFHADTIGLVGGQIISGNMNLSLRPRWTD